MCLCVCASRDQGSVCTNRSCERLATLRSTVRCVVANRRECRQSVEFVQPFNGQRDAVAPIGQVVGSQRAVARDQLRSRRRSAVHTEDRDCPVLFDARSDFGLHLVLTKSLLTVLWRRVRWVRVLRDRRVWACNEQALEIFTRASVSGRRSRVVRRRALRCLVRRCSVRFLLRDGVKHRNSWLTVVCEQASLSRLS